MRGVRLVVRSGGATLACLLACSTASASSPTGDFAGFAQCPRFAQGVELCLKANIMGGEAKIANMTLPIDRPIVLQGGILVQDGNVETFEGAIDGETLSRAPIQVAGGLTGLIASKGLSGPLRALYTQSIELGKTDVTATTELTATPQVSTQDLEGEYGYGLILPVRIKLSNQLLGEQCYIGSPTKPLVLELTDGRTSPPGPNAPIAGKLGRVRFADEYEFVNITGNSLVDNSFPVPGVEGCGGPFSSVLDRVIDARLGLPSAAGNNTVIFADDIQEAGVPGVIASEK
jgi:hypothetical protein